MHQAAKAALQYVKSVSQRILDTCTASAVGQEPAAEKATRMVKACLAPAPHGIERGPHCDSAFH